MPGFNFPQLLKTAAVGALAASHGAAAPQEIRLGHALTPSGNGANPQPLGPLHPDHVNLAHARTMLKAYDPAALAPGEKPLFEEGTSDAEEAHTTSRPLLRTSSAASRIATQLREEMTGEASATEGAGSTAHAPKDAAIKQASAILAQPPVSWTADKIEQSALAAYAVMGKIGGEVAQAIKPHVDDLSHADYDAIVDRALQKAGVPLSAAQIGAQLREICLTDSFQAIARTNPAHADALYQACGFFQPAELRMVSMLKDTAQDVPHGGTRRMVQEAFGQEMASAAAPSSTASSSTAHAAGAGDAAGTGKAEGAAPPPDTKAAAAAGTTQLALGIARYAATITNLLRSGKQEHQPGLGKQLTRAEQAQKVALDQANEALQQASALRQRLQVSHMPESQTEHDLRQQITAAIGSHHDTNARLVSAREEIAKVSVAAMLDNLALSCKLANGTAGNAADGAKKLDTSLKAQAAAVKTALADFKGLEGKSALPANEALGPLKKIGDQADAICKALEGLPKLGRDIHAKLESATAQAQRAFDGAEPAIVKASSQLEKIREAKQDATSADSAIEPAVNHGNTMLTRCRERLTGAINDKTAAETELSRVNGIAQARKSSVSLAENALRSGGEPNTSPSNLMSELTGAEAELAIAQANCNRQLDVCRRAKDAVDNAQKDVQRAEETVRALNTAKDTSRKALTEVTSLYSAAKAMHDTATKIKGDVKDAPNKLASLEKQTKDLPGKLEALVTQARQVRDDINVLKSALSRPDEAPHQPNSLSKNQRSVESVAQSLSELEQKIDALRMSAEPAPPVRRDQATQTMEPQQPGPSSQIESQPHPQQAQQASSATQPQQPKPLQTSSLEEEIRQSTAGLSKKTSGAASDNSFSQALTALGFALPAGSTAIRIGRMSAENQVPLTNLSMGQLGASIAADIGVMIEWAMNKDRKGPAFAELLNKHDHERYKEPDAEGGKGSVKVETARVLSKVAEQAGAGSNLLYGGLNIAQGATQIAAGRPGAGIPSLVAGSMDLLNGVQQALANLPTRDGVNTQPNKLMETAKDFAARYPFEAKIGSRGAALASAAVAIAFLNAKPGT